MQRFDVLPGGIGLTMGWRSSVVSAGEPRLSLADNLIDTIGLDPTHASGRLQPPHDHDAGGAPGRTWTGAAIATIRH